MASREQYARVYQELYNTEMTVGLELREGDDLAQINIKLRDEAFTALMHNQSSHLDAVGFVEAYIKLTYPGRAYFLEIERDDMGVQVFQPYGLPRTVAPPVSFDDDVPFGTWTGQGHAPGCEKLPRTARGCYCGGDHQ